MNHLAGVLGVSIRRVLATSKVAGVVMGLLWVSSGAHAQSAVQQGVALPAHVRTLLAAAAAPEMTPAGKYVGPGSCSAVACHGGIQPHTVTKVLQNEYSTWVTEDKHARAYTVLSNSLSRQIAAVLKIGSAEKSSKCLVCHAIQADAAHKARDFEISEGVSCESCHGPASAWLGPHIQPTAKHADMVRLGLPHARSLCDDTPCHRL